MLEKFDFNGCIVRMEKRADGEIWASLTDIAKATNKRVNNWTRLENTQEFLTALEAVTHRSVTETVQGGQPDKQGTWGIQQVSLKFAGWCSVDFEIWMLEKIKTLVNEGTVSLHPENQVEKIEIEKLKLEIQNLKLEKELHSTQVELMQTQGLVIQNQDLIKQSLQVVSILEEEKFEREYYLNQLHEITKEHPLFSSLIQFALTIKNEQYTFPLIGYTVKQILEMFTVNSVSEKRFANLCSDLYFLNKNKKPNEIGTYKYVGEELIYPCLILFKLEDYSWDEIKEKLEINYNLKFPTSNRKAFVEVMKRKERQLKNNEDLKGLLD